MLHRCVALTISMFLVACVAQQVGVVPDYYKGNRSNISFSASGCPYVAQFSGEPQVSQTPTSAGTIALANFEGPNFSQNYSCSCRIDSDYSKLNNSEKLKMLDQMKRSKQDGMIVSKAVYFTGEFGDEFRIEAYIPESSRGRNDIFIRLLFGGKCISTFRSNVLPSDIDGERFLNRVISLSQ